MIEYEGEIIQHDTKDKIKKLKMIIASRDNEITAWINANELLKNEIVSKNAEIEELNTSVRYFKNRNATARAKLNKQE